MTFLGRFRAFFSVFVVKKVKKLIWNANLASRGIDISAGTWVSSGAITGVHPVAPGQRVEAVFGMHGSVYCTIEAAKVV